MLIAFPLSLVQNSLGYVCLSVLFWTGSNRFYDNIEDMIGYRPLSLIKWCWKVVTPGICAVRAHPPPTFLLQSPRPGRAGNEELASA